MTIRNAVLGLCAALCLSLAPSAFGQTAPADAGSRPTMYVRDFKVEQAGNEKIEKNAGALAEALVRELSARGITVSHLGAQEAAPRTGWLISGSFSETLPGGPVAQLSSMGNSTPNTEVSLNIVDADGESSKPIGSIDMAASLGGQGKALSLNPYLIAVKAVLHHMASDRSIDDLAKRLADKVLAQRS